MQGRDLDVCRGTITGRRPSSVPGVTIRPVSKISVETASGHAREQRTAAELTQLLLANDLAGLQWTDKVVVEFKVRSHSHPVLTVNTLNTGDLLLATYLHEQLHWWTADHPGFGQGIHDTRAEWPTVAHAEDGGSRDEHSTRLHLIVCHLEWRAMQQVTGNERASAVLQRQIENRVYPWVYAQVHAHNDVLDRICTERGLWPDRLTRRP